MINGEFVTPSIVQKQWQSTAVLDSLGSAARGWAAVALGIVERLGAPEFSLGDMYKHEAELARLFPNNRNIKPKIRQQLQVLRDMGLIRFLGSGKYSLSTMGG